MKTPINSGSKSHSLVDMQTTTENPLLDVHALPAEGVQVQTRC
jgi:hypothetical protein